MKSYGMLAEFPSADALLAAVRAARDRGFTVMEAHTPFPVEGLAELLSKRPDRIPLITLIGGCVGAAGGYFMQWYAATRAYPINVGGRPLHSWPSFIPPTFELAVLGAALAAFVGMLVLSGLPRMYHPLFNVAEFHQASRNRFFLCIRSKDPRFDSNATAGFLRELNALAVTEVPM